MDLQLSEKLALVTGSTAGIGFAIAKSLALEGAHVVINGRTRQRVDEALAQLGAVKGSAKGLCRRSWNRRRSGESISGVSERRYPGQQRGYL